MSRDKKKKPNSENQKGLSDYQQSKKEGSSTFGKIVTTSEKKGAPKATK